VGAERTLDALLGSNGLRPAAEGSGEDAMDSAIGYVTGRDRWTEMGEGGGEATGVINIAETARLCTYQPRAATSRAGPAAAQPPAGRLSRSTGAPASTAAGSRLWDEMGNEIPRTSAISCFARSQSMPSGVFGTVCFPELTENFNCLPCALRSSANSAPFPHLLFHSVLTDSNVEAVSVCFSESFEALAEGLEAALAASGGVPATPRTDVTSQKRRAERG
jgi:hypothetical protein